MSSGLIGENYVVCELLRLNFEVLMPPNPVNEGWDIAVLHNEKIVRLQVKAITWPNNKSNTKPAIRGTFGANANFDFLILVVIGFYRTNKYATFIIPKDHLISASEGMKGGLPSSSSDRIRYKSGKNKSTIPFSTFKDKNRRSVLNSLYRNRWSYIKQA